jgi:antitoxin FitA
MAQLIVRNLAPRLVAQLKRRAAANGRSAEEEHRRILELVLAPPPRTSLKDLLLAIPTGEDDGDFDRPLDRGRKVSL